LQRGLATCGWGTATAPCLAHAEGLPGTLISEPGRDCKATTAWEMARRGVPHTLADGERTSMRRGDVDVVIVGAIVSRPTATAQQDRPSEGRRARQRRSVLRGVVAADARALRRATNPDRVARPGRGAEVSGRDSYGQTASVTSPCGTHAVNYAFDDASAARDRAHTERASRRNAALAALFPERCG
jgi:hypothetical protein